MMRREYTWEVMRIDKNPPPKKIKIAFDVLNAKELMQKL
jgi:hypothetical protein